MGNGSEWGAALARASVHASAAHPNNPKAARKLTNKLLGIIDEEDMDDLHKAGCRAAAQLQKQRERKSPLRRFLKWCGIR